MSNDTKIVLAVTMPEAHSLVNAYAVQVAHEDYLEKREAKALAQITNLKEKYFKGKEVKHVLLGDDITANIIRLIKEECADLVVVGAMSTKPWYSFMLSSESSKIIGQAGIPVLVVPNNLEFECLPPEEEDEASKNSQRKSFQHPNTPYSPNI